MAKRNVSRRLRVQVLRLRVYGFGPVDGVEPAVVALELEVRVSYLGFKVWSVGVELSGLWFWTG